MVGKTERVAIVFEGYQFPCGFVRCLHVLTEAEAWSDLDIRDSIQVNHRDLLGLGGGLTPLCNWVVCGEGVGATVSGQGVVRGLIWWNPLGMVTVPRWKFHIISVLVSLLKWFQINGK